MNEEYFEKNDGEAQNEAENRKENETSGAGNEGFSEGEASSVEYGPRIRFEEQAAWEKKNKNRTTALFLAVAILFSVACGLGGVLIGKRITGAPATPPPTSDGGEDDEAAKPPQTTGNTVIMQETDASAATLDGSVTAVVEKCAASVVEIITTPYSGFVGTSSGAGSGVIIGEDKDGNGTYIVTNNHVVEGNFTVITVRTVDGDQYTAELVGTDWQSDIAVLRIEKTGLTKAVWASSKTLKVGQSIVAIGNPLGSLGGSVSRGIISGVERTITVEGVPMKLLQIDAAINPGNSGGGLFDLNGNLVGIVNAKSVATSIEGIGFAIPADHAKVMVTELCEKGYVSGRVDLGLHFTESATAYGLIINSYDYPEELSTQINASDILYSLQTPDGNVTKISSLDAYRGVLVGLKAGDTVKAVILRSYGFSYRQYEVTLTAHELFS